MPSPYHESEEVFLRSRKKLSRQGLHQFLLSEGLKSEDDFYFLPRPDSPKPWQTDSITTVDVLLDETPVYETEEDVMEGSAQNWDGLKLKYLMATLPCECIKPFVKLIEALSSRFELLVFFNTVQMSAEDMGSKLLAIARELEETLDAPGSESLRILIELHYSRR